MAFVRRLFAQLTALGVVAAAFAAAAGGRYCVVDGWGTGEGLLPQSSIIAMTQTRDGYLWLGTRNGLVRFDGVHFTVFDESTTPNLSSIQTVKLFEDSRSNLWVGTESAGAMLITNGQIFKLGVGEGRRQGHLVSVCEDSVGAVWMLTQDRELARYLHGSVDVWNLATSDRYDDGRSVIAEKSGAVWVGTERSLISIDAAAVQSKSLLPETGRQEMRRLAFLLTSKTGGYWCLADGLITKRRGSAVETNFGAYPWNEGIFESVRAACEDGEGNLIVGTDQGVFWFDKNGHASRICTTNGLANDSVLSLVLDTEGSLWVGMDGGGAARHPLNRVTKSVFSVLPESMGKVIQSICEDSQGGLWFSPKNDDFKYWRGGKVETVRSMFGSMPFNPTAILADDKGQVWAATFGVNLLWLQGGFFVRVPNVDMLNPEVTALYQGRDGRLWLGTQGGLESWDGTNWQRFTTSNGLSGNIVRAIADDAQGNLWVGTEHGGLNLIHDGNVTVFQKSNHFPSDNISCLCMDSNGVLWVGTIGNGLVRMEGGNVKHFTTRNGLAGNSIDYIIDDGSGYLWIGSNAGLMRLSKKELAEFDPAGPDFLACRTYDEKDGLPATECTYGSQPAACRAHDGTLWFPTIAGMASVDPSDIKPNTNPPPVVIESILVDQQPLNTNGLRTSSPASITVPADRENLEIHFTSLNLAAAGRAIFRYHFEGSTNWTIAGKDRFVRYLKLPHGHYRFEVQARNEDGIWNKEGARLDIEILPPFWETWWFRVAASIALLGIVIAAVHYISTQKLQRQLADMRQQQALEKERARIARDIHDQVGASLTQLSLLGEMVQADSDKPAEAESHARQISQTARETARELDEIVWTVNPSNDTLDGLVNYICKNAQEYLSVAGLRYRVDVPPTLPPAAISPEARHNVFLAAKEAVTNVVRHAKATQAWLRLRVGDRNFTVEVEDNGRGPGGKDEKAAASRNGLRNMQRRMEDIGGEFFIGPGPQGGTLVRLTVPLRKR